MLWHTLKILYLLLWLVLLVHCFRKKRFFPILGSGLSTKALWLLTFLFFNPLLTLLYLIFGLALRPPIKRKARALGRVGSVLAAVLIVATVVLFEMPAIGDRQSGPVVITEDDTKPTGKPALTFEANAGKLASSNNYSTSTFSSHSQNARFSAASILILCRDDHLLLDKVTRILQQQLAAQPYVKRVTYYPPSEAADMKEMLPDVFIMLAMPRIDETKSPIGRKLDATLTCSAGRTLYPGHSHTFYSNSPPVINFGIESTLEHKSNFTGIESRQARYKQQARDIADQLAKGLIGQFDKWKDAHGLLPELPDFLYPLTTDVCDFDFLQGESARVILSGTGLLLNNHTTWMFIDDRPTLDVLKECRDKLRQLGWRGGRELDGESKHPIESMTMSKGDEQITIFRQRRRNRNLGRIVFDNSDEPAKPMPMIAHYRSLFTSDQMNNAMDQLLNADVDIETIMIFEQFIRNDQHKEKFLSLIEQNPVQSMRGCLTLADFYADENQLEKATAAFMRARVFARVDKKLNPESNRFKQIAKKLGDESLAKAAMDISHFTEAGFIDLTDRTETATVEKGLNDPAAFCIVNDEGDICTVVLTIQPAAPSSESSPLPRQYELARIVKTKNSSSVGTSSYRPGPTSVYLRDWGLDLVTIKSLANERFRFSISPKAGE